MLTNLALKFHNRVFLFDPERFLKMNRTAFYLTALLSTSLSIQAMEIDVTPSFPPAGVDAGYDPGEKDFLNMANQIDRDLGGIVNAFGRFIVFSDLDNGSFEGFKLGNLNPLMQRLGASTSAENAFQIHLEILETIRGYLLAIDQTGPDVGPGCLGFIKQLEGADSEGEVIAAFLKLKQSVKENWDMNLAWLRAIENPMAEQRETGELEVPAHLSHGVRTKRQKNGAALNRMSNMNRQKVLKSMESLRSDIIYLQRQYEDILDEIGEIEAIRKQLVELQQKKATLLQQIGRDFDDPRLINHFQRLNVGMLSHGKYVTYTNDGGQIDYIFNIPVEVIPAILEAKKIDSVISKSEPYTGKILEMQRIEALLQEKQDTYKSELAARLESTDPMLLEGITPDTVFEQRQQATQGRNLKLEGVRFSLAILKRMKTILKTIQKNPDGILAVVQGTQLLKELTLLEQIRLRCQQVSGGSLEDDNPLLDRSAMFKEAEFIAEKRTYKAFKQQEHMHLYGTPKPTRNHPGFCPDGEVVGHFVADKLGSPTPGPDGSWAVRLNGRRWMVRKTAENSVPGNLRVLMQTLAQKADIRTQDQRSTDPIVRSRYQKFTKQLEKLKGLGIFLERDMSMGDEARACAYRAVSQTANPAGYGGMMYPGGYGYEYYQSPTSVKTSTYVFIPAEDLGQPDLGISSPQYDPFTKRLYAEKRAYYMRKAGFKPDMTVQEELKERVARARGYMREAGIYAPGSNEYEFVSPSRLYKSAYHYNTPETSLTDDERNMLLGVEGGAVADDAAAQALQARMALQMQQQAEMTARERSEMLHAERQEQDELRRQIIAKERERRRTEADAKKAESNRFRF